MTPRTPAALAAALIGAAALAAPAAALIGAITIAAPALAQQPLPESAPADARPAADALPAADVRPAADAKPAADVKKPAAGAMAPHAGMMMSARGPSIPFLVHHAYKEALHAQESTAMGMPEMATNHLDNVGLVIGAIDLGRDVQDAAVRTQLTQIRDQARSLGNRPTLQGSQQLVGRFVGLIAAMPMPAGGGGGGMASLTPMLHLPSELVAMAAGAAVDAQVDASHRNFDGAKLHAQHAVAALDQALASAKLHQLTGDRLTQLQLLRTRANDVLGLVNQRSPQAVQASGQLVTQIGTTLPMLLPAP